MPLLPSASARTGETLVVSLATIAALVLLACVLAYWTWTWLAPPPEPRSSGLVETPRLESAYAMFGATQVTSRAQSGSALTLLGVAAASGEKPGHALLRVDGTRTIVVREREEVVPGLALAEVHRDHVVLDRGGARETLAWPVRATAAAKQAERAR